MGKGMGMGMAKWHAWAAHGKISTPESEDVLDDDGNSLCLFAMTALPSHHLRLQGTRTHSPGFIVTNNGLVLRLPESLALLFVT